MRKPRTNLLHVAVADGTVYRQLRPGETIRKTDWEWTDTGSVEAMHLYGGIQTCHALERVQRGKLRGYRNHFWRKQKYHKFPADMPK